MKITAKVSFAGQDFNAYPGQVIDLPEEIAKDLIGAGYAEAEKKAPEAKNEDKRDNAGTDTESAARKRSRSK